MAFLSSHGTKDYCEIPYEENTFLIFGKESTGLGTELTSAYKEHLYSIPLHSEHIRSLNLGNAVGIVVYEGLRQLRKNI
jgi:tRNA (cytidine/uridine-2'-O-)-methyltransferase